WCLTDPSATRLVMSCHVSPRLTLTRTALRCAGRNNGITGTLSRVPVMVRVSVSWYMQAPPAHKKYRLNGRSKVRGLGYVRPEIYTKRLFSSVLGNQSSLFPLVENYATS